MCVSHCLMKARCEVRILCVPGERQVPKFPVTETSFWRNDILCHIFKNINTLLSVRVHHIGGAWHICHLFSAFLLCNIVAQNVRQTHSTSDIIDTNTTQFDYYYSISRSKRSNHGFTLASLFKLASKSTESCLTRPITDGEREKPQTMSSQTPEQCTHVCNFLFNCGSPLKCTLYSTHPRTEFLRLPSFYPGDHRPIIVVLYSKTILHKLLHKMWEVQIMSGPTLPSYIIHYHLDHGKLYTSIFLFRFWHENLRFQP